MSLVFKKKKGGGGEGIFQDLLYMLLIPLVTWSLYCNNKSFEFWEGMGGGGKLGIHLQEEFKTYFYQIPFIIFKLPW